MIARGIGILVIVALQSGCVKQQPAPAESKAAYVDAKQCRGCHAAVYDSYQNVGMARAFAPAEPSAGFQAVRSFLHAPSKRHYDVTVDGNRIVQRRYELDSSGRSVNSYELTATHVVGSGNHARTYLHRSESGEFTELPLTWYAQEKRWAMSPGFDRPNPPDFTRIIDDRCLFCHNGYPQANGSLAHGIDCQRCHGPGSLHIAQQGKGRIVNPAKLAANLQLDVCMQCHLETTSAELPAMIRRFDRSVNSFRPGEPLADYVVHFDETGGNARPEKFEIASQAYRLRQSACFLKSEGRLTCTACHNPHAVERGPAAIAAQRANCRGCHNTVSTRAHPSPESADCASCHMPKRRTEDAIHVIMTDHRIQRTSPRAPAAAIQEKAPAVATPALFYPSHLTARDENLYLGVAFVANGKSRREGIAKLEREAGLPPKALAVLGEAYVAEGNAAEAIKVLGRAAQQDSTLKAAYNLGQAHELAGDFSKAAESYRTALQSNPNFPDADYALANVLAKSGDASSAIEHYRNAIRLRPTFAAAHSNLGALLTDQRDLTNARRELEVAIGIQPGAPEAYANLARVLAALGDIPAALASARRAVALDGQNALARFDLAQLLQHQNAHAAAIAEYRAALSLRNDWPEAHLALGNLFGDMGRLDEAITEFRAVLKQRPGDPEAQKNLDLALAMKAQGSR